VQLASNKAALKSNWGGNSGSQGIRGKHLRKKNNGWIIHGSDRERGDAVRDRMEQADQEGGEKKA